MAYSCPHCTKEINDVAPATALAELQAQMEAERQGWGAERTLIGMGVQDQEGQEIIKALYDRVKPDAAGAKPSIGDWLAARDSLPKAVKAYLPDSGTPAPSAGAGSVPQQVVSGPGPIAALQQTAQPPAPLAQAQQTHVVSPAAPPVVVAPPVVQGQGQAAPQPPPPANAGARPYTAAPGQFSPQSIAGLTKEEFKAQYGTILQQIRPGS